ncbi:hypothetical protein ACVWYN_002486 [Pedobacter sp. UYP24]
MKTRSLITLISILAITASAQSPKKVLKKLGGEPICFVDSVNVDHEGLQQYDIKGIASINILGKKEAIALAGEPGKDGVIFFETIPFARKRFERYFKSKSPEYEKLITNLAGDTASVQYILNDKVLTSSYEGDLATIDDKVFKAITLLTKADLNSKYGITNKEYGVLIKSGVPDDLYHGKKKF